MTPLAGISPSTQIARPTPATILTKFFPRLDGRVGITAGFDTYVSGVERERRTDQAEQHAHPAPKLMKAVFSPVCRDKLAERCSCVDPHVKIKSRVTAFPPSG